MTGCLLRRLVVPSRCIKGPEAAWSCIGKMTGVRRQFNMRMQEAGRLETCKQAVINLSEDCLWNLLSSCSNVGETSTQHQVQVLVHCRMQKCLL